MLNYCANGPSGYNLTNSLRFRSSASAYLSRTPASAGNRQIMTYSFWVKRGALTADYNLTNATTDASNSATLYFNSSNNQTFDVFLRVGATNYSLTTSQVFRDPSAWYHIVVAIDTTQATSSNRTKVYVNGSQVTNFLFANYVPQNSNLALNNNVAQYIGYSNYFDGYMTEINFIDGQALTPSSFGSTNATTGVWQPKQYTGTYGTNGFYLNFSNIALTSGSNTGLGKDYSGNGNYWNTNNISVTSGTTYDAMTDSPTLTSATVANYCTLNSTIKINSGSITEGNLKGAGSDFEGWGTIAFPSTGKFYFEYTQNGSTGVGAGPATGIQGINPPDIDYGVHYHKDGRKWVNGTYSSYGATFTTNDVIGVAYDADSNSITFYKNNVSQGAISTTSGYTYLPYQFDNSGNGGFLNFGQRPFTYTPPTGYKALNTYNLPDSTIKKGNSYMDATLYTGNGTSQSIVNAGGFKPDFIWTKSRSSGTLFNNLMDSVRGTNKDLYSNSTAAEETNAQIYTAINSNGFSVGTDNSANQSGQTFVGWQWQAGQGTTSSNTNGSITSTVSVNASAGFSIVTYTGTGANATVGHGLGVAPKMIIFKGRSTTFDWMVYHTSLGNTNYLRLNQTNASAASISAFNNTSPTSNVFSLGDGSLGNQASNTQVAYCWAEISGFSKFGSYTGNGSTDGPFVYLGFRPKYFMIKVTNAVNSWIVVDTSRAPYNVIGNYLLADTSGAEGSGFVLVDFLSNGFKMRNAYGGWNANGENIIYAAFAENPFKNSLAR